MSATTKWIRGKVSKRFTFAGYEFTEASYGSHLKLSPHSHDFVYFRHVLAGNFTEYFGNREYLLEPSSIIFRATDETHSNHFHTHTRCLTVKLGFRQFENIAQGKKLPTATSVVRNNRTSRLLARLYQELYAIDEFSELAIEGLMLEVVAETLRKSGNRSIGVPPRWLLRTKECLDRDFSENQTIKSLATTAGIHPTHLVGAFRRYFDSSIGDYVRQRRIEFARTELLDTNLPISEIAVNSGFFDQSHFTRVFKKVVGMTPAIFRATFRSH